MLPDDVIPMAHWRQAPDPRLVGALSQSVVAFAADRGMSPQGQRRLHQALLDVLEPVSAGPDEIVQVDAATDGLWLAVRVAEPADLAAASATEDLRDGDELILEFSMQD